MPKPVKRAIDEHQAHHLDAARPQSETRSCAPQPFRAWDGDGDLVSDSEQRQWVPTPEISIFPPAMVKNRLLDYYKPSYGQLDNTSYPSELQTSHNSPQPFEQNHTKPPTLYSHHLPAVLENTTSSLAGADAWTTPSSYGPESFDPVKGSAGQKSCSPSMCFSHNLSARICPSCGYSSTTHHTALSHTFDPGYSTSQEGTWARDGSKCTSRPVLGMYGG